MSDDIPTLQSRLQELMDTLINRVWAKIRSEDAEGQSLHEQWRDAVALAMKYAGDERAVKCANDHWTALAGHLRGQGVIYF